MKKIKEIRKETAFIHDMGEALVTLTPRTVEHEHCKTFDNLLYMDIEDADNDITLLFSSEKQIDKLIHQLKMAKTRISIDGIELGTDNKEE